MPLAVNESAPATLEDILATLVSFRTVSDDLRANHEALKYVGNYLAERGMHVRYLPQTENSREALIASTRADNDKTPTLLLAAHIDVITGADEMFTLKKEASKYKGRGVLDMKCAIAAYMYVVDTLQSRLTDHDFAILITCDEELGGRDGINTVEHLVAHGYIPRFVVLPDGGDNWQLEKASNGYMHITLNATGKTGHSSRPWLGENALEKITDAVHEVKSHFRNHGPETDTLNVAAIKTSNVVANQIPDQASAEISVRLRTPGRLAYWRQILADICKRHDVSMVERAGWDAIFNDIENPYTKRFAEIIEEVTGVKNTGFHSYAGSDARFYAEANIPYANCYPTGGHHHGSEEWLAEEALGHLYEVVLRYTQEMS